MVLESPPSPVLSYPCPNATFGSGPAAADLAKVLQESLERRGSASLAAAVHALDGAKSEASLPDWGADGDQPMSARAYVQARGFLLALLPWGPQPIVSTEPNGEPAFDWNFGPNRWLVASISDDGRMSFASRRGSDRLRGTTYFAGTLPSRLVSILAELQGG